jgi:BRCT domain type II-containing protein
MKKAEKPTTEKSTVEKTTSTVKDAASAVGDKLKSLF